MAGSFSVPISSTGSTIRNVYSLRQMVTQEPICHENIAPTEESQKKYKYKSSKGNSYSVAWCKACETLQSILAAFGPSSKNINTVRLHDRILQWSKLLIY